MPPAGFEPTLSAGERPQTDALDRAATGDRQLQFWDILLIYEASKRSSVFWHVMERRLVVTDVSGQLVSPFFKGTA